MLVFLVISAVPLVNTTIVPAKEQNASRAVDDGVEEDQSDSEDELPFEPFDIKNDGRIVKTASSCSRASWKHPESGWYVTITVHRFREFYPTAGMNDVQDETKDSDGSKAVMKEVEPNMQVELKLGHEDEEKGFKQVKTHDNLRESSGLYGLVNVDEHEETRERSTSKGTLPVGHAHLIPP